MITFAIIDHGISRLSSGLVLQRRISDFRTAQMQHVSAVDFGNYHVAVEKNAIGPTGKKLLGGRICAVAAHDVNSGQFVDVSGFGDCHRVNCDLSLTKLSHGA